MAIEMHDNHLLAAVPGADWIALFVQRGWIAVTNRHARCRTAEIAAIQDNNARVIVIRIKNATGSDIADLLAQGRHRIARFNAENSAPYDAGIQKNGSVSAYRIDPA